MKRPAFAVAGIAVLTVSAAAAATLGLAPDSTGTPTASDLPPQSAPITRETMLDTTEVAGALGYSGKASLAGRLPGVITRMPLEGDVIGRGAQIYRVDNSPVVLMYGAVAAYRALGPGSAGADVRQLEQNLKALGYTGFTVDTTYSGTTAAAVRRWQTDAGLPATGRIEQGRILFAPGAIRIDTVTAGLNQSTGDGQEILRYTGTGRQVTVQLPVAQQRLARRGYAVRVQLPDGKTAAGRIARAYTVIDPADGGQEQTKIQVVVALDDPAAANGIEAAVVDVTFTAGERKDVLTVPVAALVALAEGGYGVEVIDGSNTHFVRVETGLFADGRVEITGEGLQEGTPVGMPR